MAYIIYTDGRVEETKPKNGTDFSLDEMKKIVEGYIEVTQTKDGRLMVVNEEGKLFGLLPNIKATTLHKYNDPIVGNVLVCAPSEIK